MGYERSKPGAHAFFDPSTGEAKAEEPKFKGRVDLVSPCCKPHKTRAGLDLAASVLCEQGLNNIKLFK